MSDTTTDTSRDYRRQCVGRGRFFSLIPAISSCSTAFHAHEELGRPFLFEIDLSSGKLRPTSARSSAPRRRCGWRNPTEHATGSLFQRHRHPRGLDGPGRGRLPLPHRGAALDLAADASRRIAGFSRTSPPFQIITQVFRDAGFSDFEDNRQAGAGDTVLEYCVQYRETSFDFVTRLMEQFGLYYFFRHDRGQHTLVIADDPNAHDTLPDAIPFVFDQTEFRTVADHIWEWSTDLGAAIPANSRSGTTTSPPRRPISPPRPCTTPAIIRTTTSRFTSIPGRTTSTGIGQGMTDVRMQAIGMAPHGHRRGQQCARAASRAGASTSAHHPERAVNRDYLITQAEFSMSIAEGSSTVEDGETIDTYRVTLAAIPGDVPFRLERSDARAR